MRRLSPRATSPLRRAGLLSLLSLACSATLNAQTESSSERRPNIVYVLADDLGYGELGCYGSDKIRTPNVDRLAREGMCFTQHYSGSPVCAPSRCVLLTGKHTGHAIVRDNWENGGWEQGAPEGQYPLPEGTVTISSLLQRAGYATGAFGKWGNGGPGTSGHPLEQGFDRFVGYLCQRQAHNYYPTHLWSDHDELPLAGNEFFKSHQRLAEPLASEDEYYARYSRQSYAGDPMIDGAIDFLRANKDRPFFLYYASPIPHAALQVPRSEVEAYRDAFPETPYLGGKGYLPHPTPRAAYAAMVSRLDREVGRIMDELDALGLTRDTIVMFSSDNGPTFNGGTDSAFFDSAPGMRGLKCSVYEGGLRVPFVVRWPQRVTAGSTSDHLSGFQDVLPTLAAIAGIEVDARELDLDGLSLIPTLLGEGSQASHEVMYWEYAGQQAIRKGRWKGVRPRLRKGELALELYDLEADRAESKNVAAEHPEVVAELEALMEREHIPSDVFPLPTVDGE